MNSIKRLIDINREISKNTGNNERLTEEKMELVPKIEPKDLISYMVLNGNKDNHGKIKYELYKLRDLCGCIPHNILIKAEDLALSNDKFSHVERLSGEYTTTYRKNIKNIKTSEQRAQLIRNINKLTKKVKNKELIVNRNI